MSTAAKSVSTVIATIMLALSISSAALAPTSACADEIDPAAAGHGAARVEDTYKIFVCELYSTPAYDFTYKIINYVNGYTNLGAKFVDTWYGPSPRGLGAFGNISLYQYRYSTY